MSSVLFFHMLFMGRPSWDPEPGVVNVAAIALVAMCALLLMRGASESARRMP